MYRYVLRRGPPLPPPPVCEGSTDAPQKDDIFQGLHMPLRRQSDCHAGVIGVANFAQLVLGKICWEKYVTSTLFCVSSVMPLLLIMSLTALNAFEQLAKIKRFLALWRIRVRSASFSTLPNPEPKFPCLPISLQPRRTLHHGLHCNMASMRHCYKDGVSQSAKTLRTGCKGNCQHFDENLPGSSKIFLKKASMLVPYSGGRRRFG